MGSSRTPVAKPPLLRMVLHLHHGQQESTLNFAMATISLARRGCEANLHTLDGSRHNEIHNAAYDS